MKKSNAARVPVLALLILGLFAGRPSAQEVPDLSAMLDSSQNLYLMFLAQPGVEYIIQRAPTLGVPTYWVNWRTNVATAGDMVTVTDTIATSTSGFYRVAVGDRFSPNVLGFIKTMVRERDQPIANPLITFPSDLAFIFSDRCPDGTVVDVWSDSADRLQLSLYEEGWGWSQNLVMAPGQGAIVHLMYNRPFELLFLGVVPQGELRNHLPSGTSLKSSMAPVRGMLDFPAREGDVIRTLLPGTQDYVTHTFRNGSWDIPPILAPGESFWFENGSDERTWVQQFSTDGPVGVTAPPRIKDEPTSVNIPATSNAVFSVSSTGADPVSFRWLLNGNPIQDANNLSGTSTPVLTVNNAFERDEGWYSVVLSNPSGSSTSIVARLSVADPAILEHPTNATAEAGTHAVLQVLAGGTGPLSYQWLKYGKPIPGAHWAVLTFSNVFNIDEGEYSVIVSNEFGSATSISAYLTVIDPVLTTQPGHIDALAGSDVTLHAEANGSGQLLYQWRHDYNVILGEGLSHLPLTNLTPEHAGEYSVRVSNSHDSDTGPVATLTVRPGLEEATDTADLNWTTSGSAPWFRQTAPDFSGGDAARSGTLEDAGVSWMQATVAGPAVVKFKWRVSSSSAADFLGFSITGQMQETVSGTTPWEWREFPLEAGPQTLRWEFHKTGADGSGQDCGWVDNILFEAVPAELVKLSDYYPLPLGAEWIYQRVDWSDPPTLQIHRVESTNSPVVLFSGGDIVSSYTTNGIRVYGAYADAITKIAFDTWYDYRVSDTDRVGMFGSDDGGLSIRVDGGLIFPEQLAVGESAAIIADAYLNGDFVGVASQEVKLLERQPHTVPAGTFEDVLHLRLTTTTPEGLQIADEWWARGVGLIRELRVADDGTTEFELVERVAQDEPLRLEIHWTDDGPLLALWGRLGTTYIIERCSELWSTAQWEPLVEFELNSNPHQIVVEPDPTARAGYYRARIALQR